MLNSRGRAAGTSLRSGAARARTSGGDDCEAEAFNGAGAANVRAVSQQRSDARPRRYAGTRVETARPRGLRGILDPRAVPPAPCVCAGMIAHPEHNLRVRGVSEAPCEAWGK